MVCFGYYPNWSVQFANGEARYVGYNEPDRYFDGAFYWVAEENAWEWHRQDGLLPANGSYGLSATIEKSVCRDPVQKTFESLFRRNLSAARRHGERMLPQAEAGRGCDWPAWSARERSFAEPGRTGSTASRGYLQHAASGASGGSVLNCSG